jgi:hypothetical protein
MSNETSKRISKVKVRRGPCKGTHPSEGIAANVRDWGQPTSSEIIMESGNISVCGLRLVRNQ